MQIKITFESKEEALTAIHGGKYLSSIQEFDNYLREKIKYHNLSNEKQDAFVEARQQLFGLCDGFDIWD